jgi:hypothetical protein
LAAVGLVAVGLKMQQHPFLQAAAVGAVQAL